jgi:hypothetical protein
MFPRITVPQNEPALDLGDLLSAQQRGAAAGATAGGAAGATAGVGGARPFSLFFAIMGATATDNPGTIMANAPVLFPRPGPTNGAATATGPGTFLLPVTGTYKVAWQVSVTEAGQLQIALNGVGLPNTVVGRATGTSQLVGETLITATAGDVLSIINPAGNTPALTITRSAGQAGGTPVSATLAIVRFLP